MIQLTGGGNGTGPLIYDPASLFNMNKEPTIFADIQQPTARKLLATAGIHSQDDWDKSGDKLCPLVCCKGTRRPHLLNRCVVVWAGTPQGTSWMGADRARRKLEDAVANCYTVEEVFHLLEDEAAIDEDADRLHQVCQIACAQASIFPHAPASAVHAALSLLQ